MTTDKQKVEFKAHCDKYYHENSVPHQILGQLASRDEEIRKLRLANARSVDAAFHALLEMSAWMGIPEKKRHSMIEQLMENVKFCADEKNQPLTQTEGGKYE